MSPRAILDENPLNIRVDVERLDVRRLARLLLVAGEDLARRAHVALSHLSKLENGDAAPGLDLLDRLAAALGTTATQLLPSPTDERQLAQLRERTRQQFDTVLQRADSTTLTMLNAFLARF